MNVVELSNKLQAEPDLIPLILERLGHNGVEDCGSYYRTKNLDGDNPTAIAILKDNLFYTNWTRGKKGSIYNLVMDEKNLKFNEALDYVARCIGFKPTNTIIRPPFHAFYKDLIKSEQSPELALQTYSHEILPPAENLSLRWLRDGVDLLTQEKFGIRVDLDSNRICIPEYTLTGQLCGCKGRYNGECPLEERWSMVIPFSKSLTIYGYNNNYSNIQKKRTCLIVESEKAVCQASSMNFNLSLALGGHSISKTQEKYIKMLGTTTIVGFDEGICEEEIRYEASKLKIDNKLFKNKVGYIWDNEQIRKKGSKDSPTDNGQIAFETLLKHHVKWL